MEPLDPPQKFSSIPTPPAEEVSSPLSMDAAALDLVRAATDSGDDAVVRTLLRSLIALELTDAASYWVSAPPNPSQGEEPLGWPPPEPRWEQRRGFGGSTPAPRLDRSTETAPSVSTWSLPFGSTGAIVVRRETFDRDGQREAREDQLESLVTLAETLLSCVDEAAPPSSLTPPDDESESQRRAG